MRKILALLILLQTPGLCAVKEATEEQAQKEIAKEKLIEDRKKCSKKCGIIIALLTVAGFITDGVAIASTKELSNISGPITTYGWKPGRFASEWSAPEIEKKENCTYHDWEGGNPNFPYAKSDDKNGDGCARGFGCKFTIEECPGASEYKKNYMRTLGSHIASMFSRLGVAASAAVAYIILERCYS